jgi:hypothetical protein
MLSLVRTRVVTLMLLAVLWPSVSARVEAQMITSGVSQHGVSSRFYERFGVGFGFGMGGSSRVRYGGSFGSSLGLAPFGGSRGWSSGGLRAGWSVRSGGMSSRFGFSAYQASHRSVVSSSAVVTGLSGYPMSITDVVQVPFVVGVVPVGPYGAYMISPFGGYGGFGGYDGYGGYWSVPVAVGRIPYRSWRDPWWNGSAGGRFPDRSYPVVEPHETLGDRFRASRRQAASRPVSSRRSSPRRPPADTSPKGLSSAAFRQLGGRSSRP